MEEEWSEELNNPDSESFKQLSDSYVAAFSSSLENIDTSTYKFAEIRVVSFKLISEDTGRRRRNTDSIEAEMEITFNASGAEAESTLKNNIVSEVEAKVADVVEAKSELKGADVTGTKMEKDGTTTTKTTTTTTTTTTAETVVFNTQPNVNKEITVDDNKSAAADSETVADDNAAVPNDDETVDLDLNEDLYEEYEEYYCENDNFLQCETAIECESNDDGIGINDRVGINEKPFAVDPSQKECQNQCRKSELCTLYPGQGSHQTVFFNTKIMCKPGNLLYMLELKKIECFHNCSTIF